MKVLVVEEALRDLHGHWFQYISDLVHGGREAGLEIEVAVHKEACAEIVNAFPCHPVLSASVFGKAAAPAGKFSALKRVFAHNRSLYRDLAALLENRPYDMIVATTTRLDHLLAHESLYRRFHRRVQKWVVVFIDAVGTYSPDYSQLYFSRGRLPLKWAMRRAHGLPEPEKFVLAAESEGMARQFEKFCGLPFTVVPHVTHLPQLPEREERPGDPLRIGTFGFTRYDKGTDILQSAIKLLPPADTARAHFVIQWTGDYHLPDGTLVRRDPELLKRSTVEFLPPFHSSNEYYDWLSRIDLMVLPYRKAFYYDRLSRVAIDAAIAGIPIIYPAGTWLEWFAGRHASGVAFAPEDPASLAAALRQAIGRLDELKQRAERVKAATAEAFSARRFFEVAAGSARMEATPEGRAVKAMGGAA